MLFQPEISVCVSIKNRSHLQVDGKLLDLFPRCLQALKHAANTLPIEVVIADYDSTDRPLIDWVPKLQTDTFRLQLIRARGHFSRGRGLNLAVRHASADKLLLLDADVLMSPTCLQRGLSTLRTGDVFFPVCAYLTPDGSFDFWQDYGFGISFVTREVFTSVGGVPEFDSWGGEDDVFYHRVRSLKTCVRTPEIGLRHQWHPEISRNENYAKNKQQDFKAVGSAIVQPLTRVKSEFLELAQHLKEIQPFQYLKSIGNWGDGLIQEGTEKFFESHSLEYIELQETDTINPDLPAVLGGSGGFCRFWGWSTQAAIRLESHASELIVLPSTYEQGSMDWSNKKATSFYAREHQSLLELRQRGLNVLTCPDMAFWVAFENKEPTKDALNAFRTDVESVQKEIPSDNIDVSVLHDHTGSTAEFFSLVGDYQRVTTDRLHVAIAAAMLGREVIFYPGAYHKNRSMFNSTLRYFPTVKFCV